jgi:hypothetical protein
MSYQYFLYVISYQYFCRILCYRMSVTGHISIVYYLFYADFYLYVVRINQLYEKIA